MLFLLVLVTLAVCPWRAGGASRAAAPAKVTGIVFILVDDLGWADLACYGSDLHETPNIDRLAREGMRFTSAYAAAPVCSPTRAALMTGKYPARLHMTIWYEASRRPPTDRKLLPPVTDGNLPLPEVTIAEVLHDAGFATAHVGKWHLGDAAHYPETQGFDLNVGGTFWGAPATYFYPFRGLWGSARSELRYVPGLEPGEKGDYLTDRLTGAALRFLDRAGDRPFFLYMAYHTVHTPIEGKPELVERYRRKLRPGLRHANPGYAAMVHSLDENVGRILRRLEDRDLAKRTVVFLTSDNGGYINRFRGGLQVTTNHPLRSGKGSLHEGGVRVPLIVRWPGVTAPESVCAEPVITCDFYPTILAMTGLRGDPAHNALVDGVDITPLLRDPQSRLDRRDLFFHYPHYYFFPRTAPCGAIRSGDWKLVEHFEDGSVELFDLASDLGESHDLSGEKPGKARELRERLRAWRARVGAQMPSVNPRR